MIKGENMYAYKVENIGTTQLWKAMEKQLNELGKENWELINFKINEDHTLTGIFKKIL